LTPPASAPRRNATGVEGCVAVRAGGERGRRDSTPPARRFRTPTPAFDAGILLWPQSTRNPGKTQQ